MNKLLKEKKYIILVLFLLLIIPWSLSNYTDQVSPEKITSDLRFYEINTCKISINEFLISNPNVLYQDHYKLRFNNYSSLKCFGTITGIDQINHVFYISVGSNSIINLILQTTFWLLLISLIKTDKKEIKYTFKILISIFCSSLILTFGILAEKRFYAQSLYFLDLEKVSTFYQIFSYVLFTQFFSFFVFLKRQRNLIYFLPFTFIFLALFNGFNLYLYTGFFLTFGIYSFLSTRKKQSFLNWIFIFYISFWCYQAINNYYYLKPDKVRGLTSTMYSFSSVLYWSLLIIFFLYGLFKFFHESAYTFKLEKIRNNLLITSFGLVILSILSASTPIFNFLTYYYFGLTKYATDNQDLFGRNEWAEKIAWRGMFPSAETLGELFAFTLLIFIICLINKIETKVLLYFFSIFSLIGLYVSNNKAAFFSLVVCFLLKVLNTYNISKVTKYFFIIFSFIFFLFLVRFENLLLSLDFATNNMVGTGYAYGFENSRSSAIKFLIDLRDKNNFFNLIFSFIGLVGFYINRSELWGLFFARHNPSFYEVLLGTGPFNLGKHYGDIKLQETKSFLLPHSSLLNIYLYFGLILSSLLIFYLVLNIYRVKNINFDLYLIGIFLMVNIIKSDSILYSPSLIMYLVFFLIIIRKNNKSYIVDM